MASMSFSMSPHLVLVLFLLAAATVLSAPPSKKPVGKVNPQNQAMVEKCLRGQKSGQGNNAPISKTDNSPAKDDVDDSSSEVRCDPPAPPPPPPPPPKKTVDNKGDKVGKTKQKMGSGGDSGSQGDTGPIRETVDSPAKDADTSSGAGAVETGDDEGERRKPPQPKESVDNKGKKVGKLDEKRLGNIREKLEQQRGGGKGGKRYEPPPPFDPFAPIKHHTVIPIVKKPRVKQANKKLPSQYAVRFAAAMAAAKKEEEEAARITDPPPPSDPVPESKPKPKPVSGNAPQQSEQPSQTFNIPPGPPKFPPPMYSPPPPKFDDSSSGRRNPPSKIVQGAKGKKSPPKKKKKPSSKIKNALCHPLIYFGGVTFLAVMILIGGYLMYMGDDEDSESTSSKRPFDDWRQWKPRTHSGNEDYTWDPDMVRGIKIPSKYKWEEPKVEANNIIYTPYIGAEQKSPIVVLIWALFAVGILCICAFGCYFWSSKKGKGLPFMVKEKKKSTKKASKDSKRLATPGSTVASGVNTATTGQPPLPSSEGPQQSQKSAVTSPGLSTASTQGPALTIIKSTYLPGKSKVKSIVKPSSGSGGPSADKVTIIPAGPLGTGPHSPNATLAPLKLATFT